MRILHLVDSLSRNGRTVLLEELARHLNPSYKQLIVTLISTGTLTHRFTEMGIEVHAFNLYSPFRDIGQKINVANLIYRHHPDVCLCWSGDANLFSTVLRLNGIPVIWTIHNSTIRWNTFATRYGVRCAALLSKFVPEKIICCSNKTYEVYRDIHRFKREKLLVIANGVDTSKFRPLKNDRASVRRRLGIPDCAIVVATAARIELPKSRYSQGDFKDLETLFKAAAIICQQKRDTYFLLFGSNLDYDNEQLVSWLNRYELKENVKLLGFQDNVADLYSASDIFAMSSTTGEGLPISLIEAMASGVIPVCTDSGDMRKVVGSAGLIVPQKNASKLAAAILNIAEQSESQRAEYSKKAVDIVKSSYSIDQVVKRYIEVIIQTTGGFK